MISNILYFNDAILGILEDMYIPDPDDDGEIPPTPLAQEQFIEVAQKVGEKFLSGYFCNGYKGEIRGEWHDKGMITVMHLDGFKREKSYISVNGHNMDQLDLYL